MKTRRIITRTFAASAICAAIALWASCSSKPQSNDIIARKPVKAAPKPTQTMGDYSQNRTISWLGSAYTLCVERKADHELQLAKDETGTKYYDNRIKLVIKRSDDSEFFNRTFTKADFADYVGNDYKDGALLGIVFDRTDSDNLYFAASVGSPDKMSDNYVPLVLTISRLGAVKIKQDTKLDTTSDEEADEEVEE
ncbi:DUF4738 domain-containing protein [Prevotella sp.]|uniref:DUF4738 domain-containing protein n=1 Tax=Prevotella sp. TaxID=59823 RepID=UPI0030773D12